MVLKSGQIFLPFCQGSGVWQTDGQTEFSSLYRVCITCSAVKSHTKGLTLIRPTVGPVVCLHMPQKMIISKTCYATVQILRCNKTRLQLYMQNGNETNRYSLLRTKLVFVLVQFVHPNINTHATSKTTLKENTYEVYITLNCDTSLARLILCSESDINMSWLFTTNG